MLEIESLDDLRLREAGMSAFDRFHDDLRGTWGITPGYWLWPTPIRILFVIDGRVNLTSKPGVFGLGYVLDTLLAPFSWWVQFEIHVAKRDGELMAADLGSYQLKYTSFKFTDAGFNLDSYDQVWFFGHNPSDENGPVTDNDIVGGSPLDDDELKRLAEWMDRGGGVFAAGDHSILGASMCSRIPRVRTMRKWTHAQGVPSKSDFDRHQTLQPTTETLEQQEGDIVLQPLELVYRRATGPLPFLRPLIPHPLLCSGRGVIDRFPDHMHEGEVIVDDAAQLDLPLNIPDYNRPEYPFVIPEVSGSVSPGVDGLEQQRPRPHVIAFGRTTNEYLPLPPDASEVAAKLIKFSKLFGLISVYDGDPVGLGRVVVDSTWHHWFSMNLDGIAKNATQAFRKMQAYYRNVGLWLARPAQRQSMLISGTWGVLNGSAPMAFSMEMGPWEVGERVQTVLGRTVSSCMFGELIASFMDQKVSAASEVRGELHESQPSWSSLPEDLVNRAVVGGIGSALLDLALDEQEKRARGQRPRLNPEGIRQRAIDGVYRGHALLRESVENAATSLAAVHATLTASAVPRPVDLRIPIDVRQLRVVAEALQLPDPSDPVLLDRQVTLTIRVKLDDSVVAHKTIEGVELPDFDERGCIIQLSRDIGEIEVQTGERLSIEVLAGSWTSVNPEVIRFTDTRCGAISKWIGKRIPARSQAWRLWYRIEEASGPSYTA